MRCKNCNHTIILEDGVWQHYPVKGDLDFCRYYDILCDCGCKNPEPQTQANPADSYVK